MSKIEFTVHYEINLMPDDIAMIKAMNARNERSKAVAIIKNVYGVNLYLANCITKAVLDMGDDFSIEIAR